MAMNQFGDMTEAELKAYVYPRPPVSTLDKVRPADRVHEARGPAKALPTSVNWVDKGAVNPPKDQGICGSCWTFGTAGSVEGVYAVKTGKLLSISEQQFVDCAWSPWNNSASANLGCDGGFAAAALAWAIENGGLATETTYPYLMQDHWCNAADKSSGVVIKGYVNVTEGEDNLQDAIAAVGPVAVAIDATYPFFTLYAPAHPHTSTRTRHTPAVLTQRAATTLAFSSTPTARPTWTRSTTRCSPWATARSARRTTGS